MVENPEDQLSVVLDALARGEEKASEELLPLVYEHLRRLARARMAKLPPGQTLQATALVHEAYLRVVGSENRGWDGRGHFFAAAAEAMRRILVDQARRKGAVKRGGDRERLDVDDVDLPIEQPAERLLDLDQALTKLKEQDPEKERIVMLRFFGGLSREETAETLGLSPRTLDRQWQYVKAWLHRELES